MSIPHRIALLAGLALLACAARGAPGDIPEVTPLGGDRYRIGAILVDKARRQFTVPGVFGDGLSENAPLEFVAGTRTGLKLYETLLALDTEAVDFNLACILIGLDAEQGRPARQHFDSRPVAGMAVEVRVEWQADGRTVRRTAAELVRAERGVAATDDWVYTGSLFSEEGQFMAQAHGVLIGFVHAPETLIEHRTGIGLGDYGAAVPNPESVPPPGTRVTLTVIVK